MYSEKEWQIIERVKTDPYNLSSRALSELRHFILPSWSDLPEGIRSDRLITYTNSYLKRLFGEEGLLTKTMVQNYLKWGLLPGLTGRKYNKQHVAWCLAIGMLKQILNISDIKFGIIILRYSMDSEELYNAFREIFRHEINLSINHLSNFIEQHESKTRMVFNGSLTAEDTPPVNKHHLLLTAAIRALVMKIFIRSTIDSYDLDILESASNLNFKDMRDSDICYAANYRPKKNQLPED